LTPPLAIPYLRNGRNLLPYQLEDRTPEVAGDAPVRPRVPQPGAEKGVVQPLTTGGEAVDNAHVLFVPFLSPFTLTGSSVQNPLRLE